MVNLRMNRLSLQNTFLSWHLWSVLLLSAVLSAHSSSANAASGPDSAKDNVVWTTLGQNENDSMPIGNGDLAANVWTEQNGDLVLLVAKSDAWSELGKLDKLARIRIHLSENPFVGGAGFTQTLHVENASVEISSGANHLSVWIDANRPVVHVDGIFVRPSQIQARLELWRTNTHSYNEPSADRGSLFGLTGFGPKYHEVSVPFLADTILPAMHNRLTWYHYNSESIYPVVFREQHLQQVENKYPDPLLHRCFGATLLGTGLTAKDDHTLESATPESTARISLVALTTTAPETIDGWQAKLAALVQSSGSVASEQAWKEHVEWWTTFWNRSWIQVSGPEETRAIEQGYVMQRYMMAAMSRGLYPAKFNGGLFTVGGDNVPQGVDSTDNVHNPDYRKWGSAYWNQNNRHLYWPLLATGDFDLVKSWFDMYVNALPLAKDRTQLYYHHSGADFIETINFWGLPTLNDFGWDNQTNVVQSPFMRYHTQGGLEVAAQMLDEFDITQDATFARAKLVPFADAILAYYAQHWKTDANGKLLMYPSQSIETYQVDATNPAPDIAGAYVVAHRLLDLPQNLTSSQQRAAWKKLLAKLPPLPIGTTHDGKLPPFAKGDADGKRTILPASQYGETKNIENPELYTVFPYRIFSVGKPELQLARDTYNARLFPVNYCWGQDGEEASLLGLTEDARKDVIRELTNYGDQRFKWFWNTAMDWIPDFDNGGAGMMTLQNMLLQTDGRRILIAPAWPKDWTADFKLHAPFQTTVKGHVQDGKLTNLVVSPASRRKDVVLVQDGK